MSGYQEARQRLASALVRIEAARENRAAAEAEFRAAGEELSAAASEVNRFAVDPEYQPARQKEMAA